MKTELPKEILQTIEASEIPIPFRALVIDLLIKYGFEWIIDLYDCPEPKGTGTASLSVNLFDALDEEATKRIQKSVDELAALVEKYREIHGTPDPDPYEAVNEFIEGIEFTDWEDELMNEMDFKRGILQAWCDSRVDYFRSIKNLKIDPAREEANTEVESINIGEAELCCEKCGVFFYDNLSKHFGIRSLYCSITCEANTVLVCVQCDLEYTVGRGVARIRLLKLSGFCSNNCLSDFKSLKDADNKYRYSMKQTALKFNTKYDETITRREVFNRGNGICYICGQLTHFESSDEYSPLLATVDHLIPWTRGGEHSWKNVKLCCLRCNIVKGNR
jgi:hypothetical protein